MSIARWVAWVATGLVFGACGGNSRGNEGKSAGPSPNEHGTIDHGFVPPDACAFFSSASCTGEGILCKSISDDGALRVCIANGGVGSCNPRQPGDECCDSSECPGGSCHYGTPYPLEKICGEAPIVERTVCVADDCASDADCPSGVCTVADIFGNVRRCLPAACKRDADCADRPGGVCRYFWGGCCREGEPGSGGCDVCVASLPGPYRSQGIVCTYPDDGCRYDSDCPTGSQCTVVAGVAACRTECTANDWAPPEADAAK